jgi:hypothetical protein
MASFPLDNTCRPRATDVRTQRKRELKFESLEQRQLLSVNSLVSRLVTSSAAVSTPAIVAPTQSTQSTSSIQQSSLAPTASTRWDWLADTQWYVPAENLLAYATPPDLSDPVAVGDQTLWNITESSNGYIEGVSIAQLSISSSPTHTPFVGVITESGQIRFEFLQGPGQTITGIGQMRWVDGAWRAVMQMITGGSLTVTHWAYMSQADANTTPPDPDNPSVDENLMSNEWRWLEGTRWAISDAKLFGPKAKSGVFTIDEYRNGYFWGSGTSKKPFNVLGSVTPEGNVLIALSVDGGTPSTRIGQLISSGVGGVMVLRTYVDKPAIGFAWNLDGANSVAAVVARLTTTALETIRSEAAEIRLTAKQIKELAKELKSEYAASVKIDAIKSTARSSVRAVIDQLTPWLPS